MTEMKESKDEKKGAKEREIIEVKEKDKVK